MLPLKKLIKQFYCQWPSKLPTGMTDLDRFCLDIFEAYGFPDKPDYRHAIATMVLQLGPTCARKPKYFFAMSVMKAQANQVAYESIQQIREAEANARKVNQEAETKPVELLDSGDETQQATGTST